MASPTTRDTGRYQIVLFGLKELGVTGCLKQCLETYSALLIFVYNDFAFLNGKKTIREYVDFQEMGPTLNYLYFPDRGAHLCQFTNLIGVTLDLLP